MYNIIHTYIPTDRGTWWATVHRVTEPNMTEHAKMKDDYGW